MAIPDQSHPCRGNGWLTHRPSCIPPRGPNGAGFPFLGERPPSRTRIPGARSCLQAKPILVIYLIIIPLNRSRTNFGHASRKGRKCAIYMNLPIHQTCRVTANTCRRGARIRYHSIATLVATQLQSARRANLLSGHRIRKLAIGIQRVLAREHADQPHAIAASIADRKDFHVG